MMKYIRTQSGIVTEERFETYNKAVMIHNSSVSDKSAAFYEKREFLENRGESDDPSVLCDKCVVVFENIEEPIMGSFYEFNYYIYNYINKIPSNNPIKAIYGSIWTDIGLIYAAKLMQEGKWILKTYTSKKEELL